MEIQDLGIDGLDEIEQIGRGGSSRVYRARQVDLDRVVALKVLNAGDDPNVVRRFDRERKAMGRLSNNEGIVPVYSSGITGHGEPYLIMPFYEGGSLLDRLNRGPVPWDEAVGYIAAAAQTMSAAHDAGVVHLDLKPANILLSQDNAPRIADFGIAKLANDTNLATTTTAAFTPTFSAPEILLGGAPGPASDVYGLAATLWSLIAGRAPFRAGEGEDNTLMAVIGRVVHQPVDDLRHLAPDALCTVIETGMAKDPAHRYATAGALAAALAAASDGRHQPAFVDANQFDATTAIERPSAGRPGIVFEQAVPPRFVPVEPATAGGSRASVLFAFAILGALAALVGGYLLAGSLFGDDASGTSTETTDLLGPDTSIPGSTSTPTIPDSSGDGGGADTSISGGSTTTTVDPASSTTTPTTDSSSTTSEVSTTTTTEPTTTSDTPSTTAIPSTTTPTTSIPTTTTTTATTTSTSSSTSTTSTTSTTAPPQLETPSDVKAAYENRGGVSGRVTVEWDQPLSGSQIVGYSIRRDNVVIGQAEADATTFIDTNPVADTTHEYQIRADGPVSGNPADSSFSAPVEVDIPKRL